jgi:hypothetical protein
MKCCLGVVVGVGGGDVTRSKFNGWGAKYTCVHVDEGGSRGGGYNYIMVIQLIIICVVLLTCVKDMRVGGGLSVFIHFDCWYPKYEE